MEQKQNKVSMLFMLFSILFCVCLIAANVLETKQISVFGISLTGGLLVFPVSYIINDCVCEVWGYGKAPFDMDRLRDELLLCHIGSYLRRYPRSPLLDQ